MRPSRKPTVQAANSKVAQTLLSVPIFNRANLDTDKSVCATLLIIAALAVTALAPAQGVSPTRPTPAAKPATSPAAAQTIAASSPAPAPKFNKNAYLDLVTYGKTLGFTASWTKTPDTTQLTLKKPGMKLDFTNDHIEFFANSQRIFAGTPIHAYQNTLWISRIDADNLLTPIAAPASIKRPIPNLRVIAIDAGHGGIDKGTANPRLKVDEKTYTLDTANRLKILLEQKGYKVVLTRTQDKQVELGDRPAIAAKFGADLLVSIHYNAIQNYDEAQRITGVEVYRFTPRNQPPLKRANPSNEDRLANPADASNYWSALVAFQVHRALLASLRVPDRGLKHDKLAVLRLATMPAILVEPGFLTNDPEARKIMTPAYRQKIAEALAAGIQAYADALATLRKTAGAENSKSQYPNPK